MSTFGIDHAWGRPGVPALRNAGVRFVCRYLSHDTPKNLSRAEAAELSAAGIWIVVVWETTASRALSGRPGGATDAATAAAQAAACGMPAGRPIYFAVDWDASPSQQAAINAYLDGAASVLGRGRVGMYAGYGPIDRAFDAGKITFGWQTYAWSGGRWDSRAQLQQYSNDHRINGVGCDYDRAVADDYGQWRIGATPTPTSDQQEDQMPLRTSLGKTKPQDLPWGEFVPITWDTEYADPGGTHGEGNLPGYLAPSTSWADLDAMVRIEGLAPGDEYQVRYEVHDWKNGKSSGRWEEIRADDAATRGVQLVTGTMSKGLTKGQHVYLAVAVYPAPGITGRPVPRAVAGRLTIRQDQ